MTEPTLSRALRTLAHAPVPSTPPPGDLWRRGRRRHRRRVAAALAAVGVVAALVAVPVAQGSRRPLPQPADAPGVVPSIVYAPRPLQRSVADAPVGPAAMIVTGLGAFRGNDALLQGEGRTVVVGRAGLDRLIGGVGDNQIGVDTFLSPDGRRVAMAGTVDGTMSEAPNTGLSVVDLVTGEARWYPQHSPSGWAPDGRHLLVHDEQDSDGLDLLDVDSGAVRSLSASAATGIGRSYAAFAPDGRRLAVQNGTTLQFADLATGGRLRDPVDLGPDRFLAGPGAWTAEGTVAVWQRVSGCADLCDLPYSGVGVFALAQVDPATGAITSRPGPDPLDGQVPRLLGWQPDGDAVVQTYRPDAGASIVALHPNGGRARLVSLPAETQAADVAQDLLRADRFGGSGGAGRRTADWLSGVAVTLLPWALGIGALVLARVLWRRRRNRTVWE